MFDSLRPHELKHTRLTCPSLSPRVGSNSCPLSQWCHLLISFSVTPFSSCLQSFPASFPIVRKHLTRGFRCADLDLSGALWSLLIPEYSGIKRRGTPFLGQRNPGSSHYSDKYPLPSYEKVIVCNSVFNRDRLKFCKSRILIFTFAENNHLVRQYICPRRVD